MTSVGYAGRIDSGLTAVASSSSGHRAMLSDRFLLFRSVSDRLSIHGEEMWGRVGGGCVECVCVGGRVCVCVVLCVCVCGVLCVWCNVCAV